MKYEAPKLTDYGNVAELTAATDNRNVGDALIQSGQTLGIQNSTGRCQTGFQDIGGICVPIAG